MTKHDVILAVEDMVAQDGNALYTALATKMEPKDRYTNAEAASVVDSMVSRNDTVLGQEFIDIELRLLDLEEDVASDCGEPCKPGQYATQLCSPTTQIQCAACPANTFSLGGLPLHCRQCGT